MFWPSNVVFLVFWIKKPKNDSKKSKSSNLDFHHVCAVRKQCVSALKWSKERRKYEIRRIVVDNVIFASFFRPRPTKSPITHRIHIDGFRSKTAVDDSAAESLSGQEHSGNSNRQYRQNNFLSRDVRIHFRRSLPYFNGTKIITPQKLAQRRQNWVG